MKKISVLCLCLMFALSFTACGSSQTQSESSEAASEATTKSEESSAESIGTEAEPSDLSAEEPREKLWLSITPQREVQKMSPDILQMLPEQICLH